MERVGIIGGSGFGEAFSGVTELVETKWGQAVVTRCPQSSGPEIVFVPRHGAGHKIPPHLINHRANIAALQKIGVGGVLATAAVGSLKAQLKPGDFVVLDDLIDLTKGEVVTFTGPGHVQHTDMGEPYDMGLRGALLATAGDDLGATVHQDGTYLCLSGPRYETKAEIRMLAAWGGDVVGMTSAPEAILFREIQMPYACVAIVTNYGCGLLSEAVLSHSEVEGQMAQSRAGLLRWLARTVQNLAEK